MKSEVRHISSVDPAHPGACYCGQPATCHVIYGSGCGNVCRSHANQIKRTKPWTQTVRLPRRAGT